MAVVQAAQVMLVALAALLLVPLVVVLAVVVVALGIRRHEQRCRGNQFYLWRHGGNGVGPSHGGGAGSTSPRVLATGLQVSAVRAAVVAGLVRHNNQPIR